MVASAKTPDIARTVSTAKDDRPWRYGRTGACWKWRVDHRGGRHDLRLHQASRSNSVRLARRARRRMGRTRPDVERADRGDPRVRTGRWRGERPDLSIVAELAVYLGSVLALMSGAMIVGPDLGFHESRRFESQSGRARCARLRRRRPADPARRSRHASARFVHVAHRNRWRRLGDRSYGRRCRLRGSRLERAAHRPARAPDRRGTVAQPRTAAAGGDRRQSAPDSRSAGSARCCQESRRGPVGSSSGWPRPVIGCVGDLATAATRAVRPRRRRDRRDAWCRHARRRQRTRRVGSGDRSRPQASSLLGWPAASSRSS